MHKCYISMACQFEQLLLATFIKIMKVAGDKNRTAGFGQAPRVAQHFAQCDGLLSRNRWFGNGRAQLTIKILQLVQQLQHRVLAASRSNVVLRRVTKYQAANAIAVTECSPSEKRANMRAQNR